MNAKQVFRVLIIVLAALALMALVAVAQNLPTADPEATTLVSPPWWNIVENPSFETGWTNPDGWWMNNCCSRTAVYQWDSRESVDGGKSVMVSLDTPDMAGWLQLAEVQPYTDYVLSGWIKTENVAHTVESVDAGANLSINEDHAGNTEIRTPALLGTNDWTYVSVVFNTDRHTLVTVSAEIGMYFGTATGTAWFDNIQLAPVRRLYVSSSQNGKVGGVVFTKNDILVHNPVTNTWAMYLDGSDVGISGNIDALDVIPEGIVLSLHKPQNVSGLGQVVPQDLIVFHPRSTGPDTTGTFDWWLHGSDLGFEAGDEDIDAYSAREHLFRSPVIPGDGFFSTSGDFATWNLQGGNDEDIFFCNVVNWNDHQCEYYLLGTDVPGLTGEDIWGASLINAEMYLSTQDTYYPGNGSHFTNRQIFVLHSPWPELFWDGPSHGFNYVIDGFSIERHVDDSGNN